MTANHTTPPNMTLDQQRLFAAMTMLAGPEKAAAAVAQHQELMRSHGRISKAQPLQVFEGAGND